MAKRNRLIDRRDEVDPCGKYILDDDGNPQPCSDVLTWGRWFERSATDRSRIVAADKDEGPDGGEVLVSTVFLALDHNFLGKGPPVLWETLVFGGPLADEMDRYTSREAALAGHQAMCLRVREALAALQPRSGT